MASYIPCSENPRDAAPMLYSREPLSSSYSEAPVLTGNMTTYMNYASSGSYSDSLAANTQPQTSCIDIPSQQEILSNLGGGSQIVEHDFSSWRDRNEMLLMQPIGGASSVLQVGQNLQGQGLSLSLSTEIPSGIQMPSIQYQNSNPGLSSFLGPSPTIFGDVSGRTGSFRDDQDSHCKQSINAAYIPPGFPGDNSESIREDLSSYGVPSISRTVPHSKYLKVTQKLLDEVVNVRKALEQQESKKETMNSSKEVDKGSNSESTTPLKTATSSNPHETNSNIPIELSTAEKQELQNKMTKLLSMLEEVDRRYKQYHHQMQIVASSFDVIAGCGASKPYTALALHTISRHFRCLRDAITGHIQVTGRSLGEQDVSSNSKGIGISRLRYVDQQLKQHRAFSQLHMMQQHAWRPQRGLPESSVSILRAWLFEHFLHPYPKDSDKIMLARQTGLTRSQVSNWFINARVRLWKPMVEEMYKEETGNAEINSNLSFEVTANATKDDVKISKDNGEYLLQSATSTAPQLCSGYFLDSKWDHHGIITDDSDFQNQNHGESETEFGAVKSSVGNSLFPNTIVTSSEGGERFMATETGYHMSEFGRFGSGDGVSLTLGLPQCEGGSLPLSVGPTHHSFVTMRGDDIYHTAVSSVGTETADFECMDSGNGGQHRFGSNHLFHDFVA